MQKAFFYVYYSSSFFYVYMSIFNTITSYINTPLGIISVSAICVVIILIVWIIRLELKLGKILLGKSENIEQSITHLVQEQKKLKEFKELTDQYLAQVEKRLQKSIQSIETIRFNAYDGVGANQSFATVFLNENGDGVLVSSLYARDRTAVFSKQIKNHTSDLGLSEEELHILQKAKMQK